MPEVELTADQHALNHSRIVLPGFESKHYALNAMTEAMFLIFVLCKYYFSILLVDGTTSATLSLP